LLSGCMIVQDEEECIARAIENVIPAVDELVVLDGGSLDRTVDIAGAHPKVRLFTHHFDPIAGDSFADQRNRCASYAQGDWILFIDADEFFPDYVLATLPRLIFDPENDAYAFIRKTFIDGNLMNPFNLDYQIRLYKRWCKYEGKMHEGVTGHSRLRFCNLEIMHYKTTAWQQKDNERCWDMGQAPPEGWIKIDSTWVWQPVTNSGNVG